MLKVLKKICSIFLIVCMIIKPSIVVAVSDELQKIQKDVLESEKYNILDEKEYITRIVPETTMQEFKQKFNIASEKIHVYEGQEEATTGYIKTGMKAKFDGFEEEYILSVIEDINGDGLLNQIDLNLLIKHEIGYEQVQLNELQKISADLSGDGRIDQIDITATIRYIMLHELNIPEIKRPTAPIIEIIGEEERENGWYSGNIEAKIKESENSEVPIGKTIYKIIGDNEVQETQINKEETVRFEEEGENKIIAFSYSEEGAKSKVTYKTINIDKTVPTQDAPTVNKYSNKIIITSNQTDELGEIEEVKYQIRKPGEEWGELQTSNEFTELEPGTEYEVRTYVKDKAGNEQYSETVTTKSIPNPSDNIDILLSTKLWTNQDVIVRFEGNEEIEGLTIQAKLNDGEWKNTTTVTATNYNDIIYVRLTDGTNVSEISRVTIKNIDKTNPKNTAPTATATTNTITVTNKQTDTLSEIAEIKYQIKKYGEEEWSELQKSNEFTGLEQNAKYYVRTYAKDKAGNETYSEVYSITTKKIPTAEQNIGLIPSTFEWTNQNVIISAESSIQGYTIQTKLNDGEWENTPTQTATAYGDTIYARLTDGTNAGEEASITIQNIDKEKPTNTAPSAIVTTKTITVTSNQKDEISGIEEVKYQIRKHGEEWSELQTSNEFNNLEQHVEYDIRTYTKDKAENERYSKIYSITTGTVPTAEENITITPATTEWTDQNVVVTTESTVEGYTIQTKLNDGEWEDTDTQTATSNGDVIYVRLTDGTNTGEEASITIQNIDKEKPTKTAPTAVATTNTITVTNNQTDEISGIQEVKYQIKKNSEEEWGELQTSNEFIELEAGIEYEVRTYVKDKVGNEEYSDNSSIITEQYENTVTVTKNTLTYNGSEQELVTLANNQGVVYFSTETELNENNYLNVGSTEIPKAKDAGTYTVYWFTPGNVAYSKKGGNVEVTIEKQEVKGTTNVEIGTDGKVTWEESSNATGYEISIDGTNWEPATNGMNYNSTITATAGDRTVYIRAINSDESNFATTNSTASKTVTVYSVSLTKGTGISNVTGSGNYIEGTTVTLKATVITGYTWSNWTETTEGRQVSVEIEYSSKISENWAYTANTTANELTFNGANLGEEIYGTEYITEAFTEASNGSGNYTYTIKSGAPEGASIEGTNGVNRKIKFTNETPAGTYNVVITVSDNITGMSKDATFVIKINKQEVKPITTLEVGTDGKVTWEESSNATGYEISIDGTNWVTATNGINYNSTITAETGNRTIYVRAINSDESNFATSNSTVSKTVTVYNVNLTKGQGISKVTGSGNYISGATVTLGATTEPGYSWGMWTKTSSGTLVSMENAYSATISKNWSYTAYTKASELVFGGETLEEGTYGTEYTSNQFTEATNGTGNYTYEIKSGAPEGASIDSANRKLKFTNSTLAGTYKVVVTATDTVTGKEKDATFTIKINKQEVKAVTDITVETNGKVTWEESSNATSYQISMDNINWENATSGVNYLNRIIGTPGNKTIYIKALNSDTSNFAISNSIASKVVSVYSVSLTKGKGINSVTGEGNYISGATVTLGATVKTGFIWSKWTETTGEREISTENEYSAKITSNWSYTANTIANEVIFNGATLEEGTYGTSYISGEFAEATNGTGNYIYEIKSGAPTGARIEGTNGTYRKIKFINNTPAGTYNVIVTARDAITGMSKDATFVIKINKQEVIAPKNITIGTDGKVRWTESSNATGYQISINGTNWVAATSGINYKSTIIAETGNRTVYVRAVNSDTENYITPSSNASKTISVYSVTLTKGVGIKSVTGAGNYISGATVTLGATLDTGYTWGRWTETDGGKPVSTINEYTETIDKNWSYRANTQANELIFNGETLEEGVYGTEYTSRAFAVATNGTGNYTYQIKSGAPTGATLDKTNRKIKFTNSTPAGKYNVIVTALDTTTGENKDATFVIKINKQEVKPATNLAVGTDGKVTWTTSSNATGYEISIDNENWETATNGINFNSNITAETGNRTVYVRAINSDTSNFATTNSTLSKTVTVYSVTLTKGEGISTVTGAGNYISGATVTLGATVSTGYTWSKWTETTGGTQISTENEYSAEITSNWTYTANTTANALIFNGATVEEEGVYGTAYASGVLPEASNGSGSYSYNIKSGAPEGAFLDETNGASRKIKFNNETPAGTYNVVITATDKVSGISKDATFVIKINKQEVEKITDFTVNANGDVTWKESSNATGYEISIDNENWKTATNGINFNSSITAETGNRTVYVRAINSDTSNFATTNSTVSKTVTVYSVSLTKGTGISTVTGAGNYISGATVTLGATVDVGYTWSKWTETTGGTQISTEKEYSAEITSNWKYTANTEANELTFNGATLLEEGTYGTAYISEEFTEASNGSGNYTYTIKNGAPTGASIEGTNGVNRKIKFTNEAPAGEYHVVVTATDAISGMSKDATFIVKINKQEVNPITDLKIGTDGKVTWTASSNSTGYQISINGTDWETATSGIDYYSTITADNGTRTVYVRALNSDTENYTTSSTNENKSVEVYNVKLKQGKGISSVTGEGNYINGETVTLGATVDAGYTWSKWTESDEEQLSTENEYSAKISSNWLYTANATANIYTINYYNGNDLMGSSTHQYDTEKRLTDLNQLNNNNSPIENGDFYGWTTNPNSVDRMYTNGFYVKNLTTTDGDTITLYAIWARKATFYSGNNSTKTMLQRYNSKGNIYSVTKPTAEELTGWTAIGWRTDTTPTTATYDLNTETKITISNSIYYAVYSRTVTVNYTIDADTVVSRNDQKTQYYNSGIADTNTTNPNFTIVAAPTETKTGYVFNSWALGSTSGTKYNPGANYIWNPSVTDSATTYFYATWKKLYRQTVQIRYQNADGTYGNYSNAIDTDYVEGTTVSWSRAADTTYKAASITSYTVTGAKTTQVNIDRNTFTVTCQYRLQNADGSYGSWTNGNSGTYRYGQTHSGWSRAADTTYKAASIASFTVTGNTTKQVNVDRNTFAILTRYRLQNADGSYGGYTNIVNGTYRYGQTIAAWSRGATTEHNANSGYSAFTVTEAKTLSYDVTRKTFAILTRYRLQNADGSYGGYTNIVNGTYRYGQTIAAWSRGATTEHNANSGYSAFTVTGATTLSYDVTRKTFAILTRYRLENADGSYGGWNNIVNGTYRYGQTISAWSREATTEYNAASYSAFTVTSATTKDINVTRKSVAVTWYWYAYDDWNLWCLEKCDLQPVTINSCYGASFEQLTKPTVYYCHKPDTPRTYTARHVNHTAGAIRSGTFPLKSPITLYATAYGFTASSTDDNWEMRWTTERDY